ncbi:uncharacterized protein BO97DRAFT_422781 [Aspergillus homomorphus CBS 101889]|uniref:Uncharacterized protein n=1 Tax=Aspergillus homomorphus (strain CBS 101889) TaxID=1450537 RepID=A0A395I2G0_ASPHC|nr:hypothetical protein BO97DRAFT_422781 [Aspergillus homomorphus CBS 101889]RAL14362.1 hypothetical protein BO97DRAFT_422781 [Aspergillus homomorphus CBS 101889]
MGAFKLAWRLIVRAGSGSPSCQSKLLAETELRPIQLGFTDEAECGTAKHESWGEPSNSSLAATRELPQMELAVSERLPRARMFDSIVAVLRCSSARLGTPAPTGFSAHVYQMFLALAWVSRPVYGRLFTQPRHVESIRLAWHRPATIPLDGLRKTGGMKIGLYWDSGAYTWLTDSVKVQSSLAENDGSKSSYIVDTVDLLCAWKNVMRRDIPNIHDSLHRHHDLSKSKSSVCSL